MIIGNLSGAPAPGNNRAAPGSSTSTNTGGTARAAAQPQQGGAPDATEEAPAPRIVFTGEPVRSPDGGDVAAVSLRQTARIVALVASMSRTDDISAYAMLGRGEQPQTDEYRQVVSAYKDF